MSSIGARALLAATLLLAPVSARAAVTNLTATHRQGQTFLTFTEVPAAARYLVYRANAPIASLSGQRPVAELDARSGTNLYTGKGFVICDLCAPLTGSTGLLVWTTGTTGDFYYAVQVKGESDFAVTGPVREAHADVPGVVLISDWTQPAGPGTDRYATYFAWQDYSTWAHGLWGYYGHPFVLTQAANAFPLRPGKKYPLTLNLHSAGGNGYLEPSGYLGLPGNGFYLSPRDEQFVGIKDPYTRGDRAQSYWSGYRNADDTVIVPVTEVRVVRYVRAIAARPELQIDPARLYVAGASMGGQGMHILYHYPDVFAAGAESIGLPSYRTFVNAAHCDQPVPAGNLPVGSRTGPKYFSNYQDLSVTVQQARDLPPLIHTWGTEDDSKEPCSFALAIQATERAKQAYVAHWKVAGHAPFAVNEDDGFPIYFRYTKAEAYPAFSSASNNDRVEVMSAGPAGNPRHAEGQHNEYLDWQSQLHTMPGGRPIVDTPTEFGISLMSRKNSATADVTIRNPQHFRLTPGQTVQWQTTSSSGARMEAGTATADKQGRVTMHLQIATDAIRLAISCTTCAGTGAAQTP